MKRSVLITIVAEISGPAALIAACFFWLAAPVHASSGGYLIIDFSRDMLQEQYPTCTKPPVAQSETLFAIQSALQSMGVTDAGVSPVATWIAQSEVCKNTTQLYASIGDTQNLQASGWGVWIHGSSPLSSSSTTAEVNAQSCDQIQPMVANGFIHPEQMFDYKNGKHTTATQTIVAQCFDFARYYSHPGTYFTQKSAQAANWLVPALSTQGKVSGYTTEAQLQEQMTPPPGSAAIVQTYQLLDGDYGTQGTGKWWRCGSGETHGSSLGEAYCASDFYTALQNAVAAGTTVVTPYQLAQMWGRTVPGN